MATKGDQIRNLVKTLGGEPRQSTIEDAIEDLVDLFTEKRDVEMVEIVPMTEFEITDGGSTYSLDYTGDVFYFVKGETYTVILDGKEYNCVAMEGDTGDELYTYIGDSDISSDTRPENVDPFACYTYPGDGVIEFRKHHFNPDNTYTISISQKKETVTPPVVKLGGARYDLDVKDAYFVNDNDIYFINPELYQAIISGNIPVVDCWDRSRRNATAWYHYNINTVLVFDKSLVEFCGTTDSEDYSTCYFKVFPSITEFEEYMG